MILRIDVGEAVADDGRVYELYTLGNQAPLVKSKQTGRYFAITWQEIIDMAINAGIDGVEATTSVDVPMWETKGND